MGIIVFSNKYNNNNKYILMICVGEVSNRMCVFFFEDSFKVLFKCYVVWYCIFVLLKYISLLVLEW